MIMTPCDTVNMNSKHLELYTVLGEYNNTGFPLSYCLLTTASSLEDKARTWALEAWTTRLHDKCDITPRFVHTDKDMAEIGASCHAWPGAKHQLCWWHQREAVRRCLKGNLPTSMYNPWRARCEHQFVDPMFRPHGHTDPNDYEGCAPEEIYEQETHSNGADTMITSLTSGDPNSIKICLPIPASQSTQQLKLTIRIPGLSSRNHHVEPEDESEDDTANGQRTFCPIEYCDTIVSMMERHFCAHPLIPGYSAPIPEGIKSWAVKQVYEYCVHNDLPNLWAYLWENWYRCGRWELWAWSTNAEEIPHLKMTMFIEGQ